VVRLLDLAQQCLRALEWLDAQQIAVVITIGLIDIGDMRAVFRRRHFGVLSPTASALGTPASFISTPSLR
jgi:hypothetical protein